jgi:uncharacterized membrane protein
MSNCPKCNETVKAKAKFCPSCGEKLGRRTAEEKKSRLTQEKKGGKTPFYIIGALVLAGVGAFIALNFSDRSSTTVTADGSGSSGSASELTFQVGDFQDGAPKYFSYDAPSGKTVKFFILKSSDGVIRAAFDACDVCYQNKKGYRQEGDFMICNNCGQRFTSTRINEVRGGCNPAPLERTIKGDQLVIASADILTGARYF